MFLSPSTHRAGQQIHVEPGRPGEAGPAAGMASSPATVNGCVVEVMEIKEKGLGLRAIARELKMPLSSVHRALRLAA